MKKHIVLLQFYEETPECEENIQQRTAFLGQYLSKNDCQVTWIKSGFSHDAKKNLWGNSTKFLNESFKIIHVPGIGYKHNVCIKRYIHDHICSIQAFNILKNLGHIDAIVSCIPSVLISFLASRFAKKQGIPFIVDLRDCWPDGIPYVLPNRLLRFFVRLAILPDRIFLKQAMKGAKAIVSVSHDVVNWGLKKIDGVKKPIKVFYLATVKDVHLSEEETREFSEKYANLLSRNTFKVFFLGRWRLKAAPILLLEVANELLDDGVDFVVCGDGALGEQVREKSKGLKNVFLPGFVSCKEGYFLAKQCHSSIIFDPVVNIEVFPNRVFFYFMCGMALINRVSGELSEVVSRRNLGLNFSGNNIDKIKEHIFFLKNNPEICLQMGKNSRKFFEDLGNPELVYQQYVEFVKEVCK